MDANTKKLRDNYLDWALSHSSDGVRIYEKKPDRFRFESDFAIGELNFMILKNMWQSCRSRTGRPMKPHFFCISN